MRKAIVAIGYTQYVLDIDKAVKLTELLEEAELYDEQWTDGKSSHYIYEQDSRDLVRTMKIIPQSFYRIGKMAGIPANKRRD